MPPPTKSESTGIPTRQPDTGGIVPKLLVIVGAAVIVVSVALTLGNVGATSTRTVSRSNGGSVSAPGSAETPAAFLNKLATAMRQGNVDFMVSRLNPAVIARYGSPECRTAVAAYTDPTAAFSVQSTSSPADYNYTAAGVTTVIPGTITLQAIFTHQGQPNPLTVHLSRTGAGILTWYTDCSPNSNG
jgi:hypothetical protein